jgi:hypothetical protein
MSRHIEKPSIRVSRAYRLSGESYAVERAARYLKGRGHGRLLKFNARERYLTQTGLGYTFSGSVLVVLVASPQTHAEAQENLKERSIAVVAVQLGGTSSRSAKKGQWHMGGSRCDLCNKVMSTHRPPHWVEGTCIRCKKLGPLELLAGVAATFE